MKLEEIEKVCEKATSGPWVFDGVSFIFQSKYSDKFHAMVAEIRGFGAGLNQEANAEFIVISRATMPLLLDIAKASIKFVRGSEEECVLVDLLKSVRAFVEKTDKALFEEMYE